MRSRYRVQWTEVAARDYESILEWIDAKSGPLDARRVDARLRERIASLGRHPRRCRVVPELAAHGVYAYRELVSAPWRVVFALRERNLVVLAVVDGRRDLEELLLERLVRG